MTVETYDDLKQYVGSKDDFTDDLLNMGYTKGKKDGYNQALEDAEKRYREWSKSEYGKIVADDVLPIRVLRSLTK